MSASVRRIALALPPLAAVYVALLPEPELADLFVALIAAGLVLRLAVIRRQPTPGGGSGARPGPGALWRAPLFAYRLLGSVARGTWSVALISLGLRPLEGAGTVELPIGDRSFRAASLFGIAVTLSPGSVLLDVDWERRTMLFHVIGQSEAEFRADVDALWDALGLPAAPGGGS